MFLFQRKWQIVLVDPDIKHVIKVLTF